ncbi:MULTISPECIES: phosphodiester glycosidase family protein [Bacillus]|uniref:Exopolysaccharide biosynthesis protein/3',5'-cyclic AMP phosphodiesterase CpdA n=1 Tax=Bacillus capparidis TaxID=1840411 RepID=A0ABS4CZ67_9BACI|nr:MULTISPECIES: phosphodiester glycosidase family protein [Bacillus]MBP1082651.1 exopolysaccharide biosynthesis protein/3',5'-cyclic AMP phosphodiesterase CpdA [Bacillus capparidis]MED1097122.1 phosphodiester glycosidase family protein [Bacillus capparidis]
MVRKWLVLLLLFVSMMVVSIVPSAQAENAPSSDEQPRAASSDLTEPESLVGPSGKTLVTNEKTTPVGPGIELTSFERFDLRGWLNGELMTIELDNENVFLDLLFPGVVSSAKPLSEMAKTAGAIAGVNGDFFDINNTQAPLGGAIQNNQLLKGPEGSHTLTAGIDSNRIGRIANLLLEGTVTLSNGSFSLDAFNQYGLPANGIGLYTSVWGSKQRLSYGASTYEVTIRDGKVTHVSSQPGSGDIEENSYVLVGREQGADILKTLSIGDKVTVDYAPKVDGNARMSFAIGGNVKLLESGNIRENLDDSSAAPRTAVGFSENGKKMYVVAVDGRQTDSRGITYKELAALMKGFGAYNALNLDGGGSTTMVARKPGAENAEVVNQPSDGSERAVPNGIGIFAKPGSGKLKGLDVTPVLEQKNIDLVFPGLSRSYKSVGYDENYNPVETGSIKWRTRPSDIGTFEDAGVFRAKKSGSSFVQAQSEWTKGTRKVTVIGELERIEASSSRLSLESGAQEDFSIEGYDKDGYRTLIEPRDITLDYDSSVISVKEYKDGGFSIAPKKDGGSTVITATVSGHKTYLPVTIGLSEKKVSDFESTAGWSFTKYPAAVDGSIETVQGKNGQGLQLNYDFSTSTATRAAYLQADPMLELPGEVQKIGLWVHGDGNGAWLRTIIKDAANTSYTLTLASKVDWKGWKYVEATVPEGVRYPAKLWRIYPVEANKNAQYAGSLIFDDLVVKVPPEVEEVPKQSQTPDPLIIQNGKIQSDRWKFAVLADSQFAAKSPDSQQVRMARESLRQIVKVNPDFLVINGDFVDTAYKEDFELAEKILKEEVGDKLPVYYIPGNHERMGTDTLDNFLNVYEKNRYTFDHKGTRIILLDSSAGSYRTSNFEQLIHLKKSLEEAADDPTVKQVVVMAHHPTRDPLPTKNSQLNDQKESELLEQWLTAFRQDSGGKGAIYISGHAHTVHSERVEGVPYMVVGPAGKIPYGSADEGGFYSWTLFGVDPKAGPDRVFGPEKASLASKKADRSWIQAEVRPMLESITMDAPSAINAGETVKISASGHQVGDLTVPLRYPATVTWNGSENVFVGTGQKLKRAEVSGRYDAAFNPEKGELKALRKSKITLEIEANEKMTEKEIVIH